MCNLSLTESVREQAVQRNGIIRELAVKDQERSEKTGLFMHAVFCPRKQRSSDLFMCFHLVLER